MAPNQASSALVTDLSSQLALITGCTGGIGSATARALASLGCSIAIHFHQNATKARNLAEELQTVHGVRAEAFQADLSSYEEARKLWAAVTEKLGKPSILFNNAGSTLPKAGVKSIEEISIEEFEWSWRSNCGSAYLLTQLCLPAMVEKGWGRVIFCSSVAGFMGGVIGPHYASSKSALHGLIHWLAATYAKSGVTINGIAPALIEETGMLPGSTEELAKKIPLGRLGRPEEVAESVVWMVKTGYLNNKVIALDGGLFIQ